MAVDRKASLRRELVAARRALPPEVREAEAAQLCAHLGEAVSGADVVCAYVPMRTEPGSEALLEALIRLCPTVLLPVARAGEDGTPTALHWGRYRAGHLVAGPFGTREPDGPWLEPSTISTADVVLVPALAVDRHGVRLGRGGGFYDRSLPLCSSAARLVAIVRDGELLDEVPGEPHDVPMTHSLTPGGGLARLRECADRR